MKFIAKIAATIRPIRFLLAALVCTILFWTSVAPAQANMFGNSKSKLTDGVEQLNKIDDRAQQSIDRPATSSAEIEKRAQGGLNEIQGAADRDKMYTSNSSEPAVGKQIEKALDKITK